MVLAQTSVSDSAGVAESGVDQLTMPGGPVGKRGAPRVVLPAAQRRATGRTARDEGREARDEDRSGSAPNWDQSCRALPCPCPASLCRRGASGAGCAGAESSAVRSSVPCAGHAAMLRAPVGARSRARRTGAATKERSFRTPKDNGLTPPNRCSAPFRDRPGRRTLADHSARPAPPLPGQDRPPPPAAPSRSSPPRPRHRRWRPTGCRR